MIIRPQGNDSGLLPRSWATAEVDEDHLLRFGLDARARSGLHACFRRTDGEDAASRRGEALFTALTESDVHSAADNVALRQFIDVFAEMPEVDFSPEWLERLESRWRQLRQAGCSEDMPLRVVQAMVVHASRELLAGRSALSALEVEIVTALSAGGICIAESLTRAGRRESCAAVIDNLTAIGAGDVLLEGLSAALREAGGKDVGLLSVRLRMRSGTLTLGRDQRDVLMDAAVQRIGAAMRAEDVVVRTDLHSCAVILTNLQTHAQVQLAAAKVSQLLEQPLPVQGTNVRATFLVGAVWAPAHGESAEELIRCADISIEAADREDRSIVLFDDRMLAAARHEAMIEKEFVVAMENGQLQAHVQPQIDLASWRCIGGEVLLRWTDSAGNEVPAASIPEVALRVGAAAQLTRWLVFGACRVLNDLVKAGIDMQLSVNLMARDVMDPELPLLVEQAIKFWRVPPEKLVFELIESAVLEDPGVGAEVMTRLIELGVSTSIDDFGIGYSSILYLRCLPLDELKIDRAFVDVMFRSNEDREIVATLIRLAHGLGLHVVAEGVENEETMNLLCEMGCDRAQGYWISRAMPANALPEWFENWNRRHASAD